MNSNYTKDDLIRFIYNEMEPERAIVLKREMQQNAELRKEVQQLSEIQAKLNEEKHDPDDTTINLVMDYSASYYSAPEHHTE
ncbi:MAG: hypothetical protein ACN6I4_01235 [bacterium]|jgi:anti-sigma factor RsiW